MFVTNHPTTFKRNHQVHVRFILAEKDAEKEFRALAPAVNGKVSFLKSCGDYNLSVQLTCLKTILGYFRRFPLKTIKRVALIKFLVVYRAVMSSILQKRPLSPSELALVRKRAKEINKIEKLVEDKVRSIK